MSNLKILNEKSRKILIVDDEPCNTRVLKIKFENAGYKVVIASNGLDGLNKFKKEFPDAVVTDIKMPVMDGREMCRSMMEAGQGREFFVIVITSTIDRAERLWVEGMRDTTLVEKPISPTHILSIVEDYFNKPVC